MSNTRNFSADVEFAIVAEHPDLARLPGPDRATFIRRKLQMVLENGTVRDALSEVGITLDFATVTRCRETRG